MNGESNIAEPILKLSSRKRWFWLFLIVTILSPISGLILGVSLMNEPEMKKEGKIILVISIVWLVAVFFISGWLVNQGYFNR